MTHWGPARVDWDNLISNGICECLGKEADTVAWRYLAGVSSALLLFLSAAGSIGS